jgi:hypothetical protein
MRVGFKTRKNCFSPFIFLYSSSFRMAHDISPGAGASTSSEFIKRLHDVEVIKGQPINFFIQHKSSYDCTDAAQSIFL